MSKLESLLELAGSRRVVILIHHHVGVPSRIKAHFKNKGESLNLRYLQMTNAKALLKTLKGRNVTIFHGHKHVGYKAKIDNVMVVSAPSIMYGDIAGNVSPIAHYLIPTNGPSVVSIAGGLRPTGNKRDSVRPPSISVCELKGWVSLSRVILGRMTPFGAKRSFIKLGGSANRCSAI